MMRNDTVTCILLLWLLLMFFVVAKALVDVGLSTFLLLFFLSFFLFLKLSCRADTDVSNMDC